MRARSVCDILRARVDIDLTGTPKFSQNRTCINMVDFPSNWVSAIKLHNIKIFGGNENHEWMLKEKTDALADLQFVLRCVHLGKS